MSEYVVKLPDVGEGIAEAEIVEWHVAVGDTIDEDQVMVEVMTDKATVELPSPVAGVVSSLGGDVGDVLAVGSPLIRIETTADVNAEVPAKPAPQPAEPVEAAPAQTPTVAEPVSNGHARPKVGAPASAAPAVRQRAASLGIDLATITGTGPDGRVLHGDLDSHLRQTTTAAPRAVSRAVENSDDGVDEVKVIGLRRKIGRAHV